MKIKPEVILGQQLAVQADRFLEIIDKSSNPVTGGQMILREQKAAGVCYLCAKHGHISADCPGLKLGGPQNKVERIGVGIDPMSTCKTYPSCTRSGRSLSVDPGAMMHQQAGTGIWHGDTPKNTEAATQESQKKQAQQEIAKQQAQ